MAVEQLLSKIYKKREPVPPDPLVEKLPWLIEVNIREIIPLDCADAWLAQVDAPVSYRSPFYESNHRYEYWGVSGAQAHKLGIGGHYFLDQRIDIESFSKFLMEACGKQADERLQATTYLRLRLAGRIPLSGMGKKWYPEWRFVGNWRLVKKRKQIPEEWQAIVPVLKAIPPKLNRAEHTYSACSLARVDFDHEDLGCWRFTFGEGGRLDEVQEMFRDQNRYSYPGDQGINAP